jgi:hypothetical protein
MWAEKHQMRWQKRCEQRHMRTDTWDVSRHMRCEQTHEMRPDTYEMWADTRDAVTHEMRVDTWDVSKHTRFEQTHIYVTWLTTNYETVYARCYATASVSLSKSNSARRVLQDVSLRVNRNTCQRQSVYSMVSVLLLYKQNLVVTIRTACSGN